MSSHSGSRPPVRSSRPEGRVPHVAILASRWHIDYELYAQVLRARAQYVLCESDRTAAERAQEAAHAGTSRAAAAVAPSAVAEPRTAEPVAELSSLRVLWGRALGSLRWRRAATQVQGEAAYQRAS